MLTKQTVLWGLAGILLGSVITFSLVSDTSGAKQSSDEIIAEENSHMHDAMADMLTGLSGKEGVDYELAFLNEMIVHHEGALAMAHDLQTKTQRAELVQLAEDIINAQTKEIETMRAWRMEWFGK